MRLCSLVDTSPSIKVGLIRVSGISQCQETRTYGFDYPESDADKQGQIFALIESGQRIDAIGLVSEIHRYSPEEAGKWIEHLHGSSMK